MPNLLFKDPFPVAFSINPCNIYLQSPIYINDINGLRVLKINSLIIFLTFEMQKSGSHETVFLIYFITFINKNTHVIHATSYQDSTKSTIWCISSFFLVLT